MNFISFIDFLKLHKLNINNLVQIDFRPSNMHFHNNNCCDIEGFVHYEVNLGNRTLEFSLQQTIGIHFDDQKPIVDTAIPFGDAIYDLDGIYDSDESIEYETDHQKAQDILTQYLQTDLIPNWQTKVLKDLNLDQLIQAIRNK